MQFLGLLFPLEDEKIIQKKSTNNYVQNQSNIFQWNLIHGFIKNDWAVRIFNCLPVGIFPTKYKDLVLKKRKWLYMGNENLQIGTINLPIVKQVIRERRIRRYIKEAKDKNIVIYSTYLPFLKAVSRLDDSYNIVLVVTDLPEYYILGKTSGVESIARNILNRKIYNYLNRINSFVLLTEHMKNRLPIGNRPYVVVEGIYDPIAQKSSETSVKNEKKIIFYAGTLRSMYGISTLLSAFSLIDNKDMELWICGNGEMEEEICKFMKIDPRVHFFGFCEYSKVAELRQQASLLVNPRPNSGEYTKYSFPSKIMEYMASGIPIATYKLAGIPNEYDSYLNYFQDDTVNGMRDMMIQICNDSYGIFQKKAEEARRFILEEKNSVVQTKKIITLLNDEW